MKSNPLHINRTGIAAGSASACSRQAQRIAGDRGRHGVEHADEELRAFHNPAPTQTALKTSLSIDSPVDAIRSGNFKIVPSPGFRSGETSGTFSSRKEESGMPPANLPDRHPENRTRSIHSFENTKIYEYFQYFIRYPLDFCFDFIHNIRKCERFDSEKIWPGYFAISVWRLIPARRREKPSSERGTYAKRRNPAALSDPSSVERTPADRPGRSRDKTLPAKTAVTLSLPGRSKTNRRPVQSGGSFVCITPAAAANVKREPHTGHPAPAADSKPCKVIRPTTRPSKDTRDRPSGRHPGESSRHPSFARRPG